MIRPLPMILGVFYFMKKCTKCFVLKPLDEYYIEKSIHKAECKSCICERSKKRQRTTIGLIKKIYSAQKSNSKKRNHVAPLYTQKQLIKWVLSQSKFNEMYVDWVASDYNVKLIPSIDRLNDYKPYSLCNIQLVIWEFNNIKGCSDRRNGVNTKNAKAVIQRNKEGGFIKEYHSITDAARNSKAVVQTISLACRGKRKTAGGYIWQFKK